MERVDIERALKLAGLELPAGIDFHIVGQDPILASPHYLGNGAAVVRLLTGVAASELWRLRTGRSQTVVVDARHAAASLLSFLHVRRVDEPPATLEAIIQGRGIVRVTRIVAARDGRYVQLHGSFHDGPQILEELGLDESASSGDVDAAVARRDAFELEAALVRRKVCGGVVYSRQEWAEHPQGRALAGVPVLTITRIGDAAPEPLPDGDRPASGVRVIDLTRGALTCSTSAPCYGQGLGAGRPGQHPHLEGGGLFELETGIGKRHLQLVRGCCSPTLTLPLGESPIRSRMA